ncbi:MAG: redoxin domain-containing protein [Chloroflexi bacterium]|nr:redoxin domain-containing protein [Chloroflexota bacterium]
MELQRSLPDYQRAGIVLFAVSYDPIEVLAAFAAKHGITYDLLADVGSHAIRALGLLNEHIAEQHAHYGVPMRDHVRGVPYPGSFALDQNGIVVGKWFEQSYRVRPTAVWLLEDGFGGESTLPRAVAEATTAEVRVSAWLSGRSYRPYQKLELNLEVDVPTGLHVYGQPVPDGYTPLTVAVESLDGLEVGPLELPAPRPVHFAELGETLPVHKGTFRGQLSVILLKNLGPVNLSVRVSYQACSDRSCYPPGEVTVALPLEGLDNVRD